MEIMMMTKYDDDERVGKRIRGRRNWLDSGAAGEAEEIRRRPRWGRRIFERIALRVATFCMAAHLRKFDAHVCVFAVCDLQLLKT